MTKEQEIIERLEAATGSDLALAMEIAEYMGIKTHAITEGVGDHGPERIMTIHDVPDFTADFDAVRAHLLPVGYAITDMSIWVGHPARLTLLETTADYKRGEYWHTSGTGRWEAEGANVAIALCIACFKSFLDTERPE